MRGGVVELIGKVIRCRNGLGVCIPQEAVERLKLVEGESIRISVQGDTIMIRRRRCRRRWTEKELLEGITPDLCGPCLIADRRGGEII